MERDKPNSLQIILIDDFNSHAHVERDTSKAYADTPVTISTHTLTWSVTIGRAVSFLTRCISTHTLTWSVTFRGRN